MALTFVALRTALALLVTSQWVVFSQRIAGYLELRARAIREVGDPRDTDDPGELYRTTIALGDRIVSLRRASDEGDILRPPVADQLRAAIGRRLSSRDRELLLAVIRDVQPDAFVPVINSRYPGDAPFASTPTSLLKILPALPEELAYRFVRQDLLLLDRDTRLILDVVRDVLPPQHRSVPVGRRGVAALWPD